MTPPFTKEQVAEHTRLYEEGWRLCEKEILCDVLPPAPPDGSTRRQLQKAIHCFNDALAINPQGWATMWALGKIYQRLGDMTAALDQFSRAHLIKPDEPDVSREAGLAAIELGQGGTAVGFCRAAIAARPGDAGLVSNLALALLISGEVKAAVSTVRDALRSAPADKITLALQKVIDEVASGHRARPTSGPDARQRLGNAPSRIKTD